MSEINTNNKAKIRYRTEAFSGQRYRDAAEVMAFETFEMGNVDILETLSNGILKDSEEITRQCSDFVAELGDNGFIDDFSAEDGVKFYRKVLSEIKRVTGHDIKYALWLADLDTVKNFYGKDMISQDDYDAYEVGPVVLSELGYDGTLYGYTNFPEPISFEIFKEEESMNFFEQELRKLLEGTNVVDNPVFVGEACYGDVGRDLRARIEFDDPKKDKRYTNIDITLINRTEGVVDSLGLQLEDILGRKPVPGNSNFQQGVSPHIWICDKTEWYNYEPTAEDYRKIRDRIGDYIDVFRSREERYKSPLDLFIEAEVPFRMEELNDVPLTQAIKEALIQYVQDRSDIMFDYDGFDNRLLAKYDELVHESVQTYEGAIEFLCASLNNEEKPEPSRKVEDFTPIFESTNYFGVYFYNGDNEYYLVSKELGEHDLVLDDSPDFIGKNCLILLEGEQILDVANEEFLGYLAEYSRENMKGLIPERELAGLHVLEMALQPRDIDSIFEDVKRQLESEENCTAYGEPQAFVDLPNGRSIEVTLEKEMLPETDYFFSARLHCTEEEFDNNDYHSTVGIINSIASASANVDEIKDLLIATLKCNEQYPVSTHSRTPDSPSTLAEKIAAAEVKREGSDSKSKEQPERSDSERS